MSTADRIRDINNIIDQLLRQKNPTQVTVIAPSLTTLE